MYSAQGVILQREDFRERDERVTLYTKDSGKISVIAKGTKRIEAKLRGSLDVFNFVNITFVEGAYFSILTGVEVKERFPALAKDPFTYSAVLSVSRIVCDVFEEDQKDKDFFGVLYSTVEKLDEYAVDDQASLYSWLLLKKFEMIVLEGQGHAPNWASSGMSKDALRLLEMLKGEERSSVRMGRGEFAHIEEVFGKMFAYFFNYNLRSWTPVV